MKLEIHDGGETLYIDGVVAPLPEVGDTVEYTTYDSYDELDQRPEPKRGVVARREFKYTVVSNGKMHSQHLMRNDGFFLANPMEETHQRLRLFVETEQSTEESP